MKTFFNRDKNWYEMTFYENTLYQLEEYLEYSTGSFSHMFNFLLSGLVYIDNASYFHYLHLSVLHFLDRTKVNEEHSGFH